MGRRWRVFEDGSGLDNVFDFGKHQGTTFPRSVPERSQPLRFDGKTGETSDVDIEVFQVSRTENERPQRDQKEEPGRRCRGQVEMLQVCCEEQAEKHETQATRVQWPEGDGRIW